MPHTHAQSWLSEWLLPRYAKRIVTCLFAIGAVSACVTPGYAQNAEPAPAVACVDRLGTPEVAGVAQRLPDLSYDCVLMSNGRHVLVGRSKPLGELQTVLLVHGLGNNAHRDWRKVIPHLAPHFRVIAIDLPGFGSSQALPQGYSFDALAVTIAEVLDRYQLPRVHLVGHSLGGALSLHFAHRYPQRVDRLVLVDAAGILHKSVFTQSAAQIDIPGIGIDPVDRLVDGVGSRLNWFSRTLLQRVDDGFDFSRWLVDNPRVRYALLGGYTQVDAAIGLVEYDFTRAIREVVAPTTLIWGRDDRVAPLRSGEMLVAKLRDARLHILDAGHVPMIDSPARFNTILLAALIDPPTPRFNGDPATEEHGAVTCTNQANAKYTGRYESLSLNNCTDARIERAYIKQLTLQRSSATILYSSIDSDGIALIANRSRVQATAVNVSGRTAIQAEGSYLDFVGAHIRATQHLVEMPSRSRIYFSVSELAAPDFTGDAHFIWTMAPSAVSRE